MRYSLIWLVLLWCVTPFTKALAHYAYYETQTVPLQRLLANLEARQAKNTNDFEITYQLARVHSMAYATNTEQVTVRKDDEGTPVFAETGTDTGVPETVVHPGTFALRNAANQHLTNAIILYERATLQLKKSTNIVDQQW